MRIPQYQRFTDRAHIQESSSLSSTVPISIRSAAGDGAGGSRGREFPLCFGCETSPRFEDEKGWVCLGLGGEDGGGGGVTSAAAAGTVVLWRCDWLRSRVGGGDCRSRRRGDGGGRRKG